MIPLLTSLLKFYIRGVDYQPGGQSDLVDPISNAEKCKRDIPLFKELGLNAIRVCQRTLGPLLAERAHAEPCLRYR